MKRKDFFKTILGITAVAVMAPSVLAKKREGWMNIPWDEIDKAKRNGKWATVGDYSLDYTKRCSLDKYSPAYQDNERREFWIKWSRENYERINNYHSGA